MADESHQELGSCTKEEEQREDEDAKSSSPAPKHKVVIVLGATGAGKSRLAVDLALQFDGEIVNADSMQVYEGLDILTNKMPVAERKGVPHHLLGTINPSVSVTSKDFRDGAILAIESIVSRKRLPIIVGGSNYYIQALVSSFLIDDVFGDGDYNLESNKCSEKLSSGAGSGETHQNTNNDENENISDTEITSQESTDTSNGTLKDDGESTISQFDELKRIDPVSANRLHPNDSRRIKRYLEIFKTTGMLPSKLFRGEKSKKWGTVDTLRYDCCFIWVNAALPVLDRYVKQRVENMIEVGLLEEISKFYQQSSLYTPGLFWQAIGVKEFQEFFKEFPQMLIKMEAMNAAEKKKYKNLFDSAISKMKANTCRLVRKQRRRVNQLRTYFGWNIHEVNTTMVLETTGVESAEHWEKSVRKPSMDIVQSFLAGNLNMCGSKEYSKTIASELKKDLWTQYVCEACGDRVLRGAREWEQHKHGRAHRRQMMRLKKKFNATRNLQA